MNHIRYRQWIEAEGRFHYWGFIGGEFIPPFTNIPLDVSGNDSMKNSDQFTNCMDENGGKIYGGDVITYLYLKREYKAIVCYDAPSFRLKWQNTRSQLLPDLDVHNKGVAVIGNIHETPELLENSK